MPASATGSFVQIELVDEVNPWALNPHAPVGVETVHDPDVGTVEADTVIDALVVLLMPPSLEVTETESVPVPAWKPRILTETLQELLAAIIPPVRVIELEPDVAAAVPPHVSLRPFGLPI